jgi:hypothetical protein
MCATKCDRTNTYIVTYNIYICIYSAAEVFGNISVEMEQEQSRTRKYS